MEGFLVWIYNFLRYIVHKKKTRKGFVIITGAVFNSLNSLICLPFWRQKSAVKHYVCTVLYNKNSKKFSLPQVREVINWTGFFYR